MIDAFKFLQYLLVAIAHLSLGWSQISRALPPPEETPEEVLRDEIILEARSPLTGEPLPLAEYERLQIELSQNPDPLVPSRFRELIFYLQLRRVIKPIIPLIP